MKVRFEKKIKKVLEARYYMNNYHKMHVFIAYEKEYPYFCRMEEAIQEIEKYIEDRELDKALEKLASLKETFGAHKEILFLEAECYGSKQLFGKAINVYNEILTLDSEDELAEVKKEQIQSILKFTNLDIYANPNLNMDPWD